MLVTFSPTDGRRVEGYFALLCDAKRMNYSMAGGAATE